MTGVYKNQAEMFIHCIYTIFRFYRACNNIQRNLAFLQLYKSNIWQYKN